MPLDLDDPILTAYALGELEGQEKVAVEEHLADNAEARRLVDEIRAAAFVASDALRKEANDWSLQELWRAVVTLRNQSIQLRPSASASFWRRSALALAASLVVGLFIWTAVRPESPRPNVASKTPHTPDPSVTLVPVLPPTVAELPVGLGSSEPAVFTADGFGQVGHSTFASPAQTAVSSFPLTARTGSYGALSKAITAGKLPSPQAVRTEEMLAEFRWNDPAPAGDAPVATSAEVAACPWNADHRLMRIAVRTRDADGPATTPAIAARNASIEVEFNPLRVLAYRLIGYENRGTGARVAPADLVAGQTVTALYEIVPNTHGKASKWPYRYRLPSPTAQGDELVSITLNYEADQAQQVHLAVTDSAGAIDQASADLRFAAAVASAAMILRESPHKGSADFNSAIALAQSAAVDDPRRLEFIALLRRASTLSRPA